MTATSKRIAAENEQRRQADWLARTASARLAYFDRNEPDGVTIDDLPVDEDYDE